MKMRVIAILASYNEERFIANCLEHLFAQGMDAYLIDNCSTDRTLAIAERYLDRGLVGIETFPRGELHCWKAILERKEELASTLDADWFMHSDIDEIRLPPRSTMTLRNALIRADDQNFNAVNFMEYTFIPVQEEPDHDHPHYLQTMKRYYPFAPRLPHRLNAWKRQPERVELAWSGGHLVRFPGLRMDPEFCKMRHYLFLSVDHFLSKYRRNYDPDDLKRGWHGWRARIDGSKIVLPPAGDTRLWVSDDELDPSDPRTTHFASEWTSPSL